MHPRSRRCRVARGRSDHESRAIGRRRFAGLVGSGEEGFVDNTATMVLVLVLLLIAADSIIGNLLGLGFLATLALAVGFVVVLAMAEALTGRPASRSGRPLDAAFADALSTDETGPAGEVTVRPATLDDAPALARIQWEGALMAGGDGRGYRRYERFEPALAAWLAQALASEGDVLVEVADGEVVAWMALDKSLDPAHPRRSGPPWPGPPPRRRR